MPTNTPLNSPAIEIKAREALKPKPPKPAGKRPSHRTLEVTP